MKITVVGAILIVAAVMAGVLLLLALNESKSGLNDQQNSGLPAVWLFATVGKRVKHEGRHPTRSFGLTAREASNLETMIQSEWLTVTEAANYLRIKPRTLLLWVRQGKMKAFALSGTKRRVWRFRRVDLDAALLESSVLPSIPPSVRPAERMGQWKGQHGTKLEV
jgi:excisionase family DNA binding protein